MEGYKIGIIGAGNVGTHLARVFSQSKDHHVMLYARSNRHETLVRELLNVILVGDIPGFPEDLDFLFLAVNDDSISKVITDLPLTSALVMHTSGSTSMSVFEGHQPINYGVFYPLQSFAADKHLDYREIPVLAETNDARNIEKIKKLVKIHFSEVIEMNSSDRRKMHLAAVVVNNFTNHLYLLGYDFLKSNNLDFKLLLPLIKETALRLDTEIPKHLQTGPARRNDFNIINKHLEMLEDADELRNIYEMLTASIQKHHS